MEDEEEKKVWRSEDSSPFVSDSVIEQNQIQRVVRILDHFSIFGKSIAEIPCFRDSYFYGISTGLVSGLGYFMFTSRPGVATHFGMGAFCLSTLAYWSYCRWKYHEEIKKAALIKAYLQEGLIREGKSSSNDKEDMIVTI